MNVDERATTLTALWRAVRSLVPRKAHASLDELQVAIESTYNDHGDVRAATAYHEGSGPVRRRSTRRGWLRFARA
jgi:hypothetical protein